MSDFMYSFLLPAALISQNLRPYLVTGGLLLLLLLIPFVLRCSMINKDIRYAKMEMNRAGNEKERAHWKREVTALRWCYIPGMTVERVVAIRHFFRRKGRH